MREMRKTLFKMETVQSGKILEKAGNLAEIKVQASCTGNNAGHFMMRGEKMSIFWQYLGNFDICAIFD